MMIRGIIALVISLLIAGCNFCKTEPKPKPEIIYRTKIVKTNIPVKCKIKKIHCEFKGTGYTPTIKLLECMYTQKKALKKCATFIDK